MENYVGVLLATALALFAFFMGKRASGCDDLLESFKEEDKKWITFLMY